MGREKSRSYRQENHRIGEWDNPSVQLLCMWAMDVPGTCPGAVLFSPALPGEWGRQRGLCHCHWSSDFLLFQLESKEDWLEGKSSCSWISLDKEKRNIYSMAQESLLTLGVDHLLEYGSSRGWWMVSLDLCSIEPTGTELGPRELVSVLENRVKLQIRHNLEAIEHTVYFLECFAMALPF